MSGEPLRTTVVITNEQGLHIRPIASFVRRATSFQCKVAVGRPGQLLVDGRSALMLMTLAAEQGTELVLEVHGPDQEQALAALAAILTSPTAEEE